MIIGLDSDSEDDPNDEQGASSSLTKKAKTVRSTDASADEYAYNRSSPLLSISIHRVTHWTGPASC
jgi:hypothetical protein